jgi:hypothetical protein
MGFTLIFVNPPVSGRAGQTHWKAKLTDDQVEEARVLHDGGWGYRRIARRFAVPRSTIQFICTYRRR